MTNQKKLLIYAGMAVVSFLAARELAIIVIYATSGMGINLTQIVFFLALLSALIGTLFIRISGTSFYYIFDKRISIVSIVVGAGAYVANFVAQLVFGLSFPPLVLVALVVAGLLVLFLNGKRRPSQKRTHKDESVVQLIESFKKDGMNLKDSIESEFERNEKVIVFNINYTHVTYGVRANISRNMSVMPTRNRHLLKAMLLLVNEGIYRPQSVYGICGSLIYEGRKAATFNSKYWGLEEDKKTIYDALDWYFEENADAAASRAITCIVNATKTHPDNPVVQSLTAQILGTGGDLADAKSLQPLTDLSQPTEALIIGEDERDPARLMTFSGQGSLITVAPPGSGKTQCHVIPNLLNWPGPAVVLDIKGEIFAATSGWRAANVGPVYRFDPLSPGKSHAYNPLQAVSDDPDHIWEDSRFLADMLMVPGGKSKDPFWESRARDVLTAAIAATVRNNPPEERGMGKILDILHGVGWDRFIARLDDADDVPTMKRASRSLGEMDAKMRDSVLQTALASLSAWEGARIARATATSDWTPADLRSGKNPTVYICIAPNQIDSYASMLRVVIAQHIRTLTASLPAQQGHSILFVLDELPRLRHMPPVEEALEIGRQYGIKLWMFTQSLGQLETAYDNAEGMVGSCAARLFMNPSLHDETAQKLSDDMGYRESVIDGTRVKRVEADVLAGPEFKDMVIVMASGAPPARVRKHFAHADPELSRRMAIPPAGIQE